MFCDVVGSTTIAETMDPEDWSELLGRAIDIMGREVDRYGGTVAHFAGDGILALFGAPIAHEDDPYRALRAGVSILERISNEAAVLGGIQVRIGINTGLVVAGEIDAGGLNVYSALGDTLNVASRLQALAEPGTIVISDETRSLVAGDVEVNGIGSADLKGRSESVAAFEVISVRDPDERHRGVAGLTSPMIGRAEELVRLEGLVAAAAAGTGRVAVILGEPGVGKTRLSDELQARIGDQRGALHAVGRCVPYDEDLPYHLLASLVRSLAGVTASDDPEVIAKAVSSLAKAAGHEEAAEPLQALVGVSDDFIDESPEQLQVAYGEAVFGVVAGLAASHRPVLLVCEDTHWADPSSVALMSDLLERAPSTPVLLLLVMRPDRNSEGWRLLNEARSRVADALTEIHLEPLDSDGARELVANLLEIESLPAQLRAMVLDKAEGNPFFLEEVVRMLIDGGLVEEEDGRWVATRAVEGLEVPATLHGLLASRIDMLPREIRRAGRVASVVGRQFAAALAEAVLPSKVSAGATLHPHIAALEAHGIIRLAATRPALEFAFRHALIHDVMYEGLLKRERRELHGAVARAIEDAYPTRLVEFAPSLARHYVEAGDRESAVRYLLESGRSALNRGARTESYRFFTQAVELTDPTSDRERRVDAVIGAARAGRTFVPGPELIGLLEEALPLAEELGDADRVAGLYVQLLTERNMQGESYATHPYHEELDTAYALVPRLTDPRIRALLHGMMGLAHRSADEYTASVEPLTEAIASLEADGRLGDASFHASMLADSLGTIGAFAEAEEVVARARSLGVESGDRNAVADADLIRGRIAAEKGELEEALRHTRQGLEAAEAVGNTFCTLAGNFMVADQQLRLGAVEDAIVHLERSTDLAEYCNAGGYEALGQAWLAAARARLGDLDPQGFDQPLAKAMSSQSRSGEALVRFHRALAVAGGGNPEKAFDDFERALELFESYGGLPEVGRAHHAFGQALEAAGRTEEATAHLHEAEAIFARLGIRPDPGSLPAVDRPT